MAPESFQRIDVGLTEAIGILGGLGDPEATFFIPVDVHGFVDEWFGGHQ